MMNSRINQEIINPKSIVIVGGSNNIHKPGGKILQNILEGHFKGDLYVVNQKEEKVQGLPSYKNVEEIPFVELAILAIPADSCKNVVEVLVKKKQTKGFIIITAGFSEGSKEGALKEIELVNIIREGGGTLIGPNCIGMLTPFYNGVFTTPIPKLSSDGCDLVSGSGATAVFILESGIPKGLTFANVFSVGNSAMVGIEDFLEYMDETFDAEHSSKIKLLYIESINNPDKLLKHASSLIRKGCHIAAIKAGISEAGSRAAGSHTGAIVTSDLAVEALFRKAGIVRCFGREELTMVASIFMHKELVGKRIAVITHAGGPAVMLTDALSLGGLEIPEIKGKFADELLTHLFPGSSVSNPIDMLATGTAEQLGIIIDYCETKFDNIDAMMVIFGSPGLSQVFDVYELLHEKMKTCIKPIFPILPSLSNARTEVEDFLKKGHVNFPDEVLLANALSKVYNTPKPAEDNIFMEGINISAIRSIIDRAEPGYLAEKELNAILDATGIPRVRGEIVIKRKYLIKLANEIGYPLVMKVAGPLHKSDIGGVTLNIKSQSHLEAEFKRMRKLPGNQGVLLQPLMNGIELFIGAKYEPKFGHVVLCGLGGIFVEIIKDVSSGLAPLTYNEAQSMVHSLRSYKIIKGARGMEGIEEEKFIEIIIRFSTLLRFAVEIKEMDLNPLIGKGENIHVVDARVRIEKNISVS